MKNKIIITLIFSTILISCSTKTQENTNSNVPSPSPIEQKDSYIDDQYEYEPTDSISQDSDGPVH